MYNQPTVTIETIKHEERQQVTDSRLLAVDNSTTSSNTQENFERVESRSEIRACGSTDMTEGSQENVKKEKSRNIRKEQLTQLIAGKIREGELLLNSAKGDNWEVKQQDSAWRCCSKTRGHVYTVLNEITINESFEAIKTKITQRGKSSENNVTRTAIEDISTFCSINHEKVVYDAIEPQDFILLSLEKEFKDGHYKLAEMSLDDKRCTSVLGFARCQLELRYLQVAADSEARSSKLYIVHSFKLKANKDSSKDIEKAELMNELFIENILKEVRSF
mmetsp:Transcript_22971/g.26663  ORF Transcript_22971/g.26663 Transcript_22971/m.26663 type:complete len:276 (+) Transcript_22971:63-890(+)